jgi:hypothetical protein
MWRHDTWAEEHEVDEAGCKNRKAQGQETCQSRTSGGGGVVEREGEKAEGKED